MAAVTDLSRRAIVPIPKSGKKVESVAREKPSRFNRTKTAKVEAIAAPEPVAPVQLLPPSQLSLDEMAATGPVHVVCPKCLNQEPANCLTCQGSGWVEEGKVLEEDELAA